MPVFGDTYAVQYDRLYGSKDYAAECDLIASANNRFDGLEGPLLDIGCGTGGHILELARRGIDCTGVDPSAAMLGQAHRKSSQEMFMHAPKWVHGSASDFDAAGHFSTAIMMFAVAGYLTSNEELLQGLSNIRRHLRRGALFICDFWYGPAVLTVRPNDRLRELDDGAEQTLRFASTKINSFTHTADVQFKLLTIRDNAVVDRTVETHRMRYLFPQEFKLFLNQSGFECLSLSEFPSLDNPLTDESWNALCVARST